MASTCKDLEMFRIIIFGVLILCKPTKMKIMKVSSLHIFLKLRLGALIPRSVGLSVGLSSK